MLGIAASLINTKRTIAIALGALLLCAGCGLTGYVVGKYVERADNAQKDVQRVRDQAIIVYDTVVKRVPVVEYRDRINTQLVKDVAVNKEKLNEAVSARVDDPVCVLSDAERMYFNEAARLTKRAVDMRSGSDSRAK